MLDDRQRTMIERNRKVCFVVLSRHSWSAAEYLDVADEALCLAARSFHGDPEHFFSYAYKAVYHGIINARKKHPADADIDNEPLSAPDDFIDDVEDKLFAQAVIDQCQPYMTESELRAMMRVMQGVESRTSSEAGARDRALKKYRAILSGNPIKKINPNRSMTSRMREERDQKIVHLMSIGHHYKAAASACCVSERQARLVYKKSGNPKEKTASYWARVLGVDRSTVLAHASGVEKQRGSYHIENQPDIKRKNSRYSKCYSTQEETALLSEKTDEEVAQIIGRSVNAVHIARWRLRKKKTA